MSPEWNDDHHYTNNYKKIMLGVGLFIAIGLSLTTHLTLKARLAFAEVEQTTPKEYWSVVPKWEWKPVIQNHLESKNV